MAGIRPETRCLRCTTDAQAVYLPAFSKTRLMKLSSAQKRHLRALGHHLKPVVRVGQHGLGENVLQEIELALDSHELVKIKIAADRDARKAMAAEIVDRTGAEAIHSIGQVIVLFRRNPEKPKIALPSV